MVVVVEISKGLMIESGLRCDGIAGLIWLLGSELVSSVGGCK